MDSGTVAIFVVIFLFFYVLPSIIAFGRRHPNRWLILVINVAGGLTGLGWLLTLVWACQVLHKSPLGDGGESGLNMFANDFKAVTVQPSRSRELAQLKELLDSGAITRSEFDQLKTDVMTGRTE